MYVFFFFFFFFFQSFALYGAPATNQNTGLEQNSPETSNTTQYTFLQKQNSSVCNFSGKIADFHFSHYKSMETLSCHSNQSSYPPGIKNTNYVEATARNMYTKNSGNLFLIAPFPDLCLLVPFFHPLDSF